MTETALSASVFGPIDSLLARFTCGQVDGLATMGAKEARRMARLADLTKGQWDQFDRVLNGTNLTAEEVLRLIEFPEALRPMLKTMREQPAFHCVQGLFTPAKEQIEIVRRWNAEHDWRIPENEFRRAVNCIPDWPKEKLVAIVLVPYLEGSSTLSGDERTFLELWKLARETTDDGWMCWDGKAIDHQKLELLDGCSKELLGLRWEVIALDGDRFKTPLEIRAPELSPHAGILAAAALHPRWIWYMDGAKIPEVWIPGYKVVEPMSVYFPTVPRLGRIRGSHRGIEISAHHAKSDAVNWAVPKFLKLVKV